MSAAPFFVAPASRRQACSIPHLNGGLGAGGTPALPSWVVTFWVRLRIGCGRSAGCRLSKTDAHVGVGAAWSRRNEESVAPASRRQVYSIPHLDGGPGAGRTPATLAGVGTFWGQPSVGFGGSPASPS